jgi:hypothetical protein
MNISQLYSLPDRWLRAIDFAVGVLSAYAAWSHQSYAWGLWSLLAFVMCATNATAKMQALLHRQARRVAMAMALRSF